MANVEPISAKAMTIPVLLEYVRDHVENLEHAVVIALDKEGEPRVWCTGMNEADLTFLTAALTHFTQEIVFGD